jgi:DNA topoisomerase-1
VGRAKVIPFPTDPLRSAEAAGLRYVRDTEPGIRRVRAGRGVRYVAPDGATVTEKLTLNRIRSLVIPPAWTNVWICAKPDGHIQAVGRDAKGRKQYRYHPSYRHQRDQTKFGRMLSFGKALELIRARVEQDLTLPGLPRHKVLAAVVRLLETTCTRIGNEEYKQQNNSFGLTTLQDHHVEVEGSRISFRFRGKSGQQQEVELNDPRLARIVRKCRDIPGYELFQYYDESGNVCNVTSSDVNEYIREIGNEDFTAKDFRTWGGTGWAALIFEQLGRCETEAEAKKRVVETIKQVAQRLGNRPATCRKYYVHPAVLDAYSDGSLFDALKKAEGERRQEAVVMKVVSDYVNRIAADQETSKDFSDKLPDSIRKRA